MFWYWYASSYRSRTCWGSSSTPGFSKSSRVAVGFSCKHDRTYSHTTGCSKLRLYWWESSNSEYLPELLEFIDLLCCDLPGPQLLLLRRDLHQPGQEAAVLNEGLPLRAVPINVLQTALTGTRLPKHTNMRRRQGTRLMSNGWQLLIKPAPDL